MGRKPLLDIFAAAVTLALLNFVVRERSPTFHGVQCNCTSKSNLRLSADKSRDFAQHDHNRQYRNDRSPASSSPEENASSRARVATFPIRTHILSLGRPRTATTVLFSMATVSYFLYFLGDEDKDDSGNNNRAFELQIAYSDRMESVTSYLHKKEPWVIKAHLSGLEDHVTNNTLIFTTAWNRFEALETKERLSQGGHAVAFVQDMDTLKEFGSAGLVPKYVAGFGLSSRDQTNMIEYFSHWEILRQCCGKQMSARWRNDLWPDEFKVREMPHHPTCPKYDMDVVERAFMDTELYSLIDRYPNMQQMNRPSIVDGSLNGTYCSSYSRLVHTRALDFNQG